MIYRIEKCPDQANQGASSGFYWAATLKKAKQIQRRSYKEYLAVGGDGELTDIIIQIFETPASKSDLLDFLKTWCSYPDNG